MKTFRKYWKMEAKSIQKTPLSLSWAVSTSYLTALPPPAPKIAAEDARGHKMHVAAAQIMFQRTKRPTAGVLAKTRQAAHSSKTKINVFGVCPRILAPMSEKNT